MRAMIPALLLVTVSLSLSVAAQAEDAPALSPTSATLWAHHDTADTEEITGWANTLAVDGDDTAMGPSAACATAGTNGVNAHTGERDVDEVLLEAVGEDVDRTYTITLAPAQTHAVTLDAAGDIKATLYAGATSCFGLVDLSTKLTAGGVTIAEGTVTDHWYDNNAAQYASSEIVMKPLVASVALSDLTWTVTIKGTTAGAVYLGVSEEKGPTNIVLPITGAGAGPAANATDDETANATTNQTSASTSAPEPTTTSASGNATANSTTASAGDDAGSAAATDGEGVPVPLPVALAGLAGAGLLWRRRRLG